LPAGQESWRNNCQLGFAGFLVSRRPAFAGFSVAPPHCQKGFNLLVRLERALECFQLFRSLHHELSRVTCASAVRRQKDDSQRARSKSGWMRTGSLERRSGGTRTKESGTTLQAAGLRSSSGGHLPRTVKTVVLWKLDRLSRRLKDGITILADWCERGLKIVVVTQQIELNGAVGRMIAALLLGRRNRVGVPRDRQRAGIAVAKRKGGTEPAKGTTKGGPIGPRNCGTRLGTGRNRSRTWTERADCLSIPE